MKKLLWLNVVVLCLATLDVPRTVRAQVNDAPQPLVFSDAVLPSTSENPLLDPRIFTPEFYRKFNPDLNLSTDAEAIQQWTSRTANHCLRGSFYFYAPDYLKR